MIFHPGTSPPDTISFRTVLSRFCTHSSGFCKAYGRCRATADKNMELMKKAWNKEQNQKNLPPLISWEEAGRLPLRLHDIF